MRRKSLYHVHVNEPHHNVLLIGGDGPLLRAAVPLLRRTEFDVHRVAGTSAVLDLLHDTSFELIIIEGNASPVPLSEMVAAVRHNDSLCRHSGLIVIADDGTHSAAQGLLQRGVNRVVPAMASAGELLHAVADLLAVAPRHELRTIVQLEVRMGAMRNRTLAQTANLSLSGMLVRGGLHLAPGTEIDFELMLPGQPQPVRGRATVVRHSTRRRELVDGFGARFFALQGDDHSRLESFLARRH
jgi:DNA-binding NarL/FixJ family response regulator